MNLSARLEALEQAGLIRPTAGTAEAAYLFRHGLIQDAAYSTLLKPQRRAWHRVAGETLEALAAALAGPAAESLAPVLAQHFSIAGDEARALRYFIQAADAAFDRYALAEAADYYAQALALASGSGTAAERLHAARRYGLTLEHRSQYEAALRHYAETEQRARDLPDAGLELAMLMEQAKVYATANLSYNPERSRALLERAAPLAAHGGDHAAQARLLWTLMLQNLMRGGDPDERQAYGEQALAIAQAHDLREQMAYIYQDLWFAYGGRRHWDQTRETLEAARRLWTELDNPVGECEAVGRLSIVAMVTGEYDRSLELADEAFRVAARIPSPDMQALSHAFAGLVHADRGEYAQAIAISTEAVNLGQPSGNVTVLVGTQADLGFYYGELGDPERGLPYAQAAHALGETQFPLLAGWSGAVLARLHLMRGDVPAAAEALQRIEPYQTFLRRAGFMAMMWTHTALAEAELALAQGQAGHAVALMTAAAAVQAETGMRFRRPETLYLRGRGLQAQGRLGLARAALQAARLEAIALDARRTQWRILAALAEIEEHSGQPEAAAIWRRQARPILEHIVAHTPTDLRAAFLARPEVWVGI